MKKKKKFGSNDNNRFIILHVNPDNGFYNFLILIKVIIELYLFSRIHLSSS